MVDYGGAPAAEFDVMGSGEVHMPCRTAFTSGLIGLFLVSVVICAEGTGEDPVLRKGTDDLWSTMKTENFTIYYGKDFASDAQRAKTYLNSTIESMVEEFSEYEPEEILKKVDCHFYLHPEPNEKASDGRSVCIMRGLDDGRRHAEIHFLTPARYSPDSRNSVGELKRANHTFFRYIVHEYSSIFLGVVARGKGKGWYANGNDPPNWFWQGYEEYLGMTLSSAHSRSVTFSKYMALVKEDPDTVMVAYGYRDKTPRIVVHNDYRDGFAVLAFMHHQFGKKAVQSILSSEKETFRDAMRDSFQIDAAEFYEKYQQWVQEWKSP
ncbi:MAG: hypothetical protein HQ582_11205 [Planctomycetes bacterium]|nr:hypothetical protein [Planctomycetota bacterium]